MSKVKYIIFTADVQAAQSARLKAVIADCVNQQYDELYFLISSGGGNVFEGLSIASLIHALPMNTVMHNIGQVDSVATVIFASAKKRYSSSAASFMFHGVTMNLPAAGYLEQQLKEFYDSSKRLKSDIAIGISNYTGLLLSDIESLMIDGGQILNADQARERGFVTGINEPQIPQGADVVTINNA